MYIVTGCKVVYVVWRETGLWGGVLWLYSVFCYTAQAGKEVKIQNRVDFIVIVFYYYVVISVILFVTDLIWHSLLFYHRLQKHAFFDLMLKN